MPRSTNTNRLKSSTADVTTAVELLEPIVSFLKASGATEETVKKALELSWTQLRSAHRKVSVDSLDRSSAYGDLVAMWKHDPKYLSQSGNPKALSLSGPGSFSELVSKTDPELDPRKAARNLQRFGNVAFTKAGKLRLLTEFFHVRSGTALAFEPSARFLADFAASVSSSLKPKTARSKSGPFWRMAEARDLPARHSRDYEQFAKDRSLEFVLEIDEWLRKHGAKPGDKGRSVRAGIGVFAILPKSRSGV